MFILSFIFSLSNFFSWYSEPLNSSASLEIFVCYSVVYLPSFNWETNEPEGSTVSESKFYRFSGFKLVESGKPSYEGSTVLIGSFDNIVIGNLVELKAKLERLASSDMAF